MYRILAVIFLALVSCQEEGLVGLDFTSFSLSKVSGDGIEVVSHQISEVPLVIKVTDATGNPQVNVPIAWSLYDEDGDEISSIAVFLKEEESMLLGDLMTDELGIARCFVSVPYVSSFSGTRKSIPLTVGARITQVVGVIDTQSEEIFSIEALDESHNYQAQKINGDGQSGKILLKSKFPIEFQIINPDGYQPQNYDFTVTSENSEWELELEPDSRNIELAGDWQDGYSGNTDFDGRASFYWIYGNEPGEQALSINIFNSSGTHIEGSPLRFTAEIADLDLFLHLEKGDGQTAAASTGLPIPLTVTLKDEDNLLVEGYEVVWEVPSGHKIQKAYFWDDEIPALDDTHYVIRSNEEGSSYVRLVTSDETGSYTALAHVYDGFGSEVNGSPVSFDYSTYSKGTYTDPRDNKSYVTIEYNGATWFAQNLDYRGGNGDCYYDLSTNCDDFGTLYTWEEALISPPPGWHVPTDQEWKNLEGYLGMDPSVIDDYGQGRDRVFDLGLLNGEWSGFNIIGGGFYTPSGGYSQGYSADGQWTATEYNTERAILRVLGDGWYFTVARFADSKEIKAYVRCVKD